MTTDPTAVDRQPAYDAVFAYIRQQPRDFLPTNVVDRNAMIWRAVNAALDAVVPPPTDRAALREAVAGAVRECLPTMPELAVHVTTAVLAVLGEQTGWATVCAQTFVVAANYVRGVSADRRFDNASVSTALCVVSDELRRLAVEAHGTGTQQPESTAPLAAGLPLVKGNCPACGHASLFLGSGGYVTCSIADCPKPGAATKVLKRAGAQQQPDTEAPAVPRQTLVDLVRDFLDPDPCYFDHHGYCQAHSWLCGGSPCPHGRAREVLAAIDADEPAPVAQQPAADTCRPVDVDGETVLVRGSGKMTEQDREFFGEIVRAAKRKYAAEHGAEQQAAAADGEETRQQAHAEGEHAFCGPECDAPRCTCADAGDGFVPLGHYRDCPLADAS